MNVFASTYFLYYYPIFVHLEDCVIILFRVDTKFSFRGAKLWNGLTNEANEDNSLLGLNISKRKHDLLRYTESFSSNFSVCLISK